MLVLLVGLAYLVVATKITGTNPEVLGYQVKSVLSGSMEPDIQTGSVIAIKTGGDMTRFNENDVITFIEEENILITHRITEVKETDNDIVYVTKGDNNNAEDSEPVLTDNVVGEYTGLTIPYLGYIIHFAQSKNGAFLLLIPGLMLLCYSGYTFWKTLREIETSRHKENESTSN